MSAVGVSGALTELREALLPVRLPLPLPDAADRARLAGDIRHQLDDYILPRLADIEAPVLAVVGGSTGAGKSTIVNTLIGRVVSTPGVIRPTTRSPVLVHHPDDAHWFDTERILPGLIRSRVSSGDAKSLQLVAEPTLPRGLALLDAPDVDSVVASNRRLAAQLLQAADLWLFTTSAARYADAVPWDFLHSAVDRHAAVAVVLNRVPPGAMSQVPAHLGQLMTERGLAEAPLFAVPETPPDAEGLLPDAAVAPIRTWLATLAADQASRQRVVLQTLDGAIGAVASRAPLIAAALDEQSEALDRLRSDADRSFAEAVRAIGVQSADGTLLRGEVLSRWHEFVGTGDVMRALDEKVSWLRDRVWGSIKGTPPEAKHVGVAVEAGLEALVRDEADAAAERAEAAWQATPAGREVLRRLAASGIDLARVSPEFPAQAARAIRDWQGDVMELVAGEGMGKRSRARFLALGVNGASVALMVAVFAHTGGLTGAEVGIAGGSSVIAQRLLESVFGDEAIRRLAERAKSDLDARISGLLAAELARYDDALTGLAPDGSVAGRIRRAASLVEEARISGYASPTAIEGPASGALEASGGTRVNQVTAAADADVVEAELVDRAQPERRAEDRR